MQALLPIDQELRKVEKIMMDAMNQHDRERGRQVHNTFQELIEKRMGLARSFAISNPNSFVSPVIALSNVRPLDPTIYEKFSPEVKACDAAKRMKFLLDTSRVQVGSIAPDLTAKTPEGEDLSLAEVLKKGNYTLVNFWASWSRPCREENLKILKLYKHYHEKGFNVLGVSSDESLDKWKEAIKADKLNWYHISDLKESKLAASYGVKNIPSMFLIHNSGRVVANVFNSEELAQVLGEMYRIKGLLKIDIWKWLMIKSPLSFEKH